MEKIIMQLCFSNKGEKILKNFNRRNFQRNNEVRNKTFPDIQNRRKN